MSQKNWSSVMDTNVSGVFYCAQSVGKVMLGQKHGKINIASMYAFPGSATCPRSPT